VDCTEDYVFISSDVANGDVSYFKIIARDKSDAFAAVFT
jgi:hypothetical protein